MDKAILTYYDGQRKEFSKGNLRDLESILAENKELVYLHFLEDEDEYRSLRKKGQNRVSANDANDKKS